MVDLLESRSEHEAAPAFPIVINAETPPIPAFFVVASRIGRKENPARHQRSEQLLQNTRQIAQRNMKEAGIRKDSIEMRGREIERKKILLPHRHAGVRFRHSHECGSPIEPGG